MHRPLYDWFIQALEIYPSHQYEFARLNLTYTMMSKRRLLKLVQEGAVMGWDDPRMPTICALRRKGYTPASVRNFAEMVGVAKRDNVIDLGKLEYCVREDLNKVAQRRKQPAGQLAGQGGHVILQGGHAAAEGLAGFQHTGITPAYAGKSRSARRSAHRSGITPAYAGKSLIAPGS